MGIVVRVVRVSNLHAFSIDDNTAATLMLWQTIPRRAKVKNLRGVRSARVLEAGRMNQLTSIYV